MVKPTEKRIYFTRHAQAEHNVAEDYSIHDAPLTALGREQSRKLNEDTKDTIQQTAELLVTSGLRRTMQTTLHSYPVLKARLDGVGKPVIVLPQLQEVNAHPCDVGSDVDVLHADPEFADLDLSLLTPEWNKKRGFYAPDVASLKARARWNRRWLRARPEAAIVVVSHGDCLRYITDGESSARPWANTEVQVYTFATDDEGADEDARVVLLATVAWEGEDDPTSSSGKFA